MAFLLRHKAAIIISLIVGYTTFVPQFFPVWSLGSVFQGIYKEVNDDQYYYLARAREVIDGHAMIANAYLEEHKNDTALPLWVPDYLLAKPLAFFHTDVVRGFLAYDLIFPVILFLLTYGIFYSIIESKILALSGSVILHFGIFLSEFHRSPSPQFNFIFWLLFFLSIIRFCITKRALWKLTAALAFGTLFYIYTFYWSFSVIFLIFCSIFFWFLEKDLTKQFLQIIGGGLLVALPFFYMQYTAMRSPWYLATLFRHGLIYSHFPSGLLITFFGVLIIAAFFIMKKKGVLEWSVPGVVLLSAASASVVSINQHMLTGKNLEFSSHYFVISVFSFFFLGFFLIKKYLERYASPSDFLIKKIYRGIFFAAVLISIPHAVSTVRHQMALNDHVVYQQRYQGLFRWLNANTAKDSVIFANEDISYLLPAYTADNTYYQHFANLFLVGDKEIQDRFIIAHYFDTFDDQFLFLQNHIRDLWGLHYIDEYAHNQSKNALRKFFFQKPKAYTLVPDAEKRTVQDRAKQIQSEPFEKALKQFHVDYLIWDKDHDPSWHMNQFKFLTPAYTSGNIMIYMVH